MIDGKKDGLSMANSSVQSASSAMGATVLSVSATTLQPASRAAEATRRLSCEYGANAVTSTTSLAVSARSSISSVPASPRTRCTELRNSR
ncbi:hypothetical protein D3C85_1668060 [compost metagenome]